MVVLAIGPGTVTVVALLLIVLALVYTWSRRSWP